MVVKELANVALGTLFAEVGETMAAKMPSAEGFDIFATKSGTSLSGIVDYTV